MGQPRVEDEDEDGRTYRVGEEINVNVKNWGININLKVGDVVYLTSAARPLKAARLVKHGTTGK